MGQPVSDKRAHIRAYLMILLQEGVFERARTPVDVITRASAAFARDVGAVVGDMAREFGAAGASKLATSVAEIGGSILADFAARTLDRLKRG